MMCPSCSVGELIRCRRESLGDFILSCLGIYPYTCKACQRPVYRPRWEQFLLITCVLVIGVLATGLVGGTLYYRMRNARVVAAQRAEPPMPQIEIQIPLSATQARGSDPLLTLRVDQILGNDDIVRLTQAHMGNKTIIKLIERCAHSFDIDPKSLVAMKKAGTPDEIIDAVIESTTNSPLGRQKPSDARSAAFTN